MRYFILTLSLILGLGKSVSADDHLPNAGEILQRGKVLHKEVHLMRDAKLVEYEMDVQEFTTGIGQIVYHVIYGGYYYTCRSTANAFGIFTDLGCWKLSQKGTSEYKEKN